MSLKIASTSYLESNGRVPAVFFADLCCLPDNRPPRREHHIRLQVSKAVPVAENPSFNSPLICFPKRLVSHSCGNGLAAGFHAFNVNTGRSGLSLVGALPGKTVRLSDYRSARDSQTVPRPVSFPKKFGSCPCCLRLRAPTSIKPNSSGSLICA